MAATGPVPAKQPRADGPVPSVRVGPRRRFGQGGAAAVALACVIAGLCVPLAAGVARVGAAASEKAAVDAAADLVALATVTGGPPAGHEVAIANRVDVVEVSVGPDGSAEVTVRRGGVRAGSAAAPAG